MYRVLFHISFEISNDYVYKSFTLGYDYSTGPPDTRHYITKMYSKFFSNIRKI